MTDAHLVIDGRPGGLPEAPLYYRTFPQEPSPLGDLTLNQKTTTVMNVDNSLFAALAAIAKAGKGGVVVLVCHAVTHEKDLLKLGIRLPIAPGGISARSTTEGLDRIDRAMQAESDVGVIRAMVHKTETERRAVIKAWTDFITRLGGTITGQVTDYELGDGFAAWVKEADKRFEDWVTEQSELLEFHSAAGFRALFPRVSAVRRLKLARFELRACDVGNDRPTMERLRKFIGAGQLTAPTHGTFYARVPLYPLIEDRRRALTLLGPSRSLRPIGSDALESIVAAEKLLDVKSTRGFLPKGWFPSDVSPNLQVLGLRLAFARGIKRFTFVLRVEEKSEFDYKPWAWVHGTGRPPAPDASVVQEFVRGWIMPSATFAGAVLPLAGLWTPDIKDLPFVLPWETAYTKLIATTP